MAIAADEVRSGRWMRGDLRRDMALMPLEGAGYGSQTADEIIRYLASHSIRAERILSLGDTIRQMFSSTPQLEIAGSGGRHTSAVTPIGIKVTGDENIRGLESLLARRIPDFHAR